MSEKDYSVVMSPLLAHKIDEISTIISSNLQCLESKINILIERVSILEEKLNDHEKIIEKKCLENYENYWGKSS